MYYRKKLFQKLNIGSAINPKIPRLYTVQDKSIAVLLNLHIKNGMSVTFYVV